MKLNELKTLINQQAIQSKLELTLNEVGPSDITRTSKSPPQKAPETDWEEPTISDEPTEFEGAQNPELDSLSTQRMNQHLQNPSLTDKQRKGVEKILRGLSRVPSPAPGSETRYSEKQIMDNILDLSYSLEGDPEAKDYIEYIKSETLENSYEIADKQDSIDALSTGPKTVSGKAPKKTDEINMMNEAIRNIKSILANR